MHCLRSNLVVLHTTMYGMRARLDLISAKKFSTFKLWPRCAFELDGYSYKANNHGRAQIYDKVRRVFMHLNKTANRRFVVRGKQVTTDLPSDRTL